MPYGSMLYLPQLRVDPLASYSPRGTPVS